ncbi:Predicted dehydrogenase [Bryocella elongata]|uniref:Predicted dehydrogenase n=1 Tax=Bryocella elongata TaxID=863522 RepID=A0A1H5UC07_9BACT|nr:Gfo/Idh/MocA family oxidoreductase [Bryocella elongata]SEF72655.1 Predicted dehydrogenase [Bryocella elongata]
MVRLAVIGLGKMGLSHVSMIRVHPNVNLVAVCDTSGFLLDILSKYTGMKTYSDFEEMLRTESLDAVLIATPSRFHESMVRLALDRGIHVFCEKPFSLDAKTSAELAALAESKSLIGQVGYHYRFVAAFQEMKRLLDLGAIGKVTHVLAEAYGPVVLRPSGSSWRSQAKEGGGCLYDYAAHPVNLLNWFFGEPMAVSGTVLNSIFSKDTDDEAYSTLRFAEGISAHLSVNWSDESYRKMSVKITATGTQGRIYADRQEIQVYLRNTAETLPSYNSGWTVNHTTELTQPVWFYVRGEEYSAQLDYFVRSIETRELNNVNSFTSAAQTDKVLSLMRDDANGLSSSMPALSPAKPARRFFFRR